MAIELLILSLSSWYPFSFLTRYEFLVSGIHLRFKIISDIFHYVDARIKKKKSEKRISELVTKKW